MYQYKMASYMAMFVVLYCLISEIQSLTSCAYFRNRFYIVQCDRPIHKLDCKHLNIINDKSKWPIGDCDCVYQLHGRPMSNDEFMKQTNLSSVTGINANLARIKNEWFPKHNNILTVELTGNVFYEVGANSFKDLKRVKEIILQRNMIKTLHAYTFEGLFSLERLDLNDNEITDFRPFAAPSNLTMLFIAKNKLSSIDKMVLNTLPQLQRLDLSCNQITGFDRNVFENMKNLLSLYLSSNKIKNLRSNFTGGMHRLVHLNLRRNQISEIRRGIFVDIKNEIKVLDLSDNNIDSIEPFAFSALTHLSYLHLQKNNIESLAIGVFDGLEKLHKLDLSCNKMRDLQAAVLLPMASLHLLKIVQNDISFVRIETKTVLSKIKRVEINENPWQCRGLQECLELFTSTGVKHDWCETSGYTTSRGTLTCVEIVESSTDQAVLIENTRVLPSLLQVYASWTATNYSSLDDDYEMLPRKSGVISITNNSLPDICGGLIN